MRGRARLVLGGAAVVVVGSGAAAGWLAWTASTARAELTAVRAELGPLRSGVLTGDPHVTAGLERAKVHAAAADDATHDPVWAVAAAIPGLGSPLATVRGLTAAVDGVATQSLPPVAEAAANVHPARLLSGGALDVAGLARAAGPLGRAAQALRAQRDAVHALDPSWVGEVATARADLLGQLESLAAVADSAHTAATVTPSMLGANGPRRYFVGFQNPAEARGTGGLLDAYAVVRAERGRIVVERTGSNAQLPRVTGTPEGLDDDYLARYGAQGGASIWLNANLSPHFPDAGKAWTAMWRAATGEQLDGAIALDPRALAAVLSATGPVTAPVVGSVDSGQIENLVLHEQYERPELAARRKDLMLAVGIAAMNAVLKGTARPQVLVPALSQTAGQGHVLIYSRMAGEQQVLARSGLTGSVDAGPGPFAQAVVVNAGGNKLDSWLNQSLGYRVEQCTPSRRRVAVSVVLRNDAPTSGLPEYVTVRSDRPRFPVVPGQNRIELQLLVTQGATLVSATLDGRGVPTAPAQGSLPATLPDGGLWNASGGTGFIEVATTAGHPAFGLDLELVPGKPRTLVVRFDEPTGTTGPPNLPVQPLVRTPRKTADVTKCAGGS